MTLEKSKGGSQALILKVGEHPFIKQESEVAYDLGVITSIERIQAEMRIGTVTTHAPMNMELVQRIARLAKGHPAIPLEVEEMILRQWDKG
jgi:hypothetical protein